jgi:hypothetical protein
MPVSAMDCNIALWPVVRWARCRRWCRCSFITEVDCNAVNDIPLVSLSVELVELADLVVLIADIPLVSLSVELADLVVLIADIPLVSLSVELADLFMSELVLSEVALADCGNNYNRSSVNS